MEEASVKPRDAFYQEVYAFATGRDMSDPANYERFCQIVDVDSLVDWEGKDPDLDLLQRLAVFFRTTPDALLDFDRQRIDEEVKALVSDSCPLTGDPQEREAFYREALKKYPNNELLLNYLLMVLPDSRAREKIEIGERLLDTSSDDAIRLDVLRLLAQTCHNIGEQSMAESYLRRMPEFSYLRQEALPELYP